MPHRDRAAALPSSFQVLDILELLLDHLQIRFVRFDGSTSAATRQELIDAFDSDPSIGVFLLSTRAGGLGINLTAADTVILHDVDFNPAMDQQAMDRCHRMGQLRPVRVIRLASARTVDERMIALATQKHEAQRAIVGAEEGASIDLLREAIAALPAAEGDAAAAAPADGGGGAAAATAKGEAKERAKEEAREEAREEVGDVGGGATSAAAAAAGTAAAAAAVAAAAAAAAVAGVAVPAAAEARASGQWSGGRRGVGLRRPGRPSGDGGQ